jgi:hypothetical protein
LYNNALFHTAWEAGFSDSLLRMEWNLNKVSQLEKMHKTNCQGPGNYSSKPLSQREDEKSI